MIIEQLSNFSMGRIQWRFGIWDWSGFHRATRNNRRGTRNA